MIIRVNYTYLSLMFSLITLNTSSIFYSDKKILNFSPMVTPTVIKIGLFGWIERSRTVQLRCRTQNVSDPI